MKGLPSFGPYKAEREKIIAEHKKAVDLLGEEMKGKPARPALQPKDDIPKLQVNRHFVSFCF